MVYYLKINQDERFVYVNLDKWLDAISSFPDAKLYLLCDNEKPLGKIRERFPEMLEKVELLRSARQSPEIIDICLKVLTGYSKAGAAHLTTFFHAREMGYTHFWNIDADDTFLAVSSEQLRQIMEEVEALSEARHIHALSLDMWPTRWNGLHWSFGVTYIDNTIDWFGIMERYALAYRSFKVTLKDSANIDWYFTFLRKYSGLSIESFYVENLRFMHVYQDFLNWATTCGGVYCWEKGKLYLYGLRDAIGERGLGELPIYKDVIRLKTEARREDGVRFLKAYMDLGDASDVAGFWHRYGYEMDQISHVLLDPFLALSGHAELNMAEKLSGVYVTDGFLQLRERKLRKDVLYVLCPGGVGDTLYTAAFMQGYIARTDPGKSVCYIVTERQKEILSWFPAAEDVWVSDELVSLLDFYASTRKVWRLKNFLYGKVGEQEIDAAYQGDVVRAYREGFFSLPEDIGMPEPKIMVSPDAMQALQDTLPRIGKKTVILLPYSAEKNGRDIPPLFWNTLSQALLRRGYEVLTYVEGEETVLPGTTALRIGHLGVLAACCEAALAVVSARNGLCDLLAYTGALLFVISPTETGQQGFVQSYHSLRDGMACLLCDEEEKALKTATDILLCFS